MHYRDLPDMLEQLKEEVFEKIKGHIAQQTPLEMGRIMSQIIYYGPLVSSGLRDKASNNTRPID